MAESYRGYDAPQIPVDTVQEKLRQAMVMALPVDDTYKPTFNFERQVDFAQHDREGSPWDWTAAPIADSQQAAVQPICVYEFFSPLGRQGAYPTEVGEFTPTTVVITMLQDEFDEVNGFSYVTIGPGMEKWYFRYWTPAIGLGGMTIYQIHCVSGGE